MRPLSTSNSRSAVWFGLAALLVANGACKSQPTERQATSSSTSGTSTVSAPTANTTAAPPSATASSESTATAAHSTAPPATVACKSTGPKDIVELGHRPDYLLATRPWGNRVYTLSWNEKRLVTTVAYFGRDGGSNGTLGTYKGHSMRKPNSLWLTPKHAYFVVHDKLVRLPIAGGDAEIVTESFGQLAVLHDAHFYGVRCGSNRKDHVVKLPSSGGTPVILGTIDRTSSRCLYGGIGLADGRAIIADRGSQRLVSLDLETKNVAVFATPLPMAHNVYIQPDHVDVLAGGGMFRLGKDGGPFQALGERVYAASSPKVVWDGVDYFLFGGTRGSAEVSVLRINSETMKTQTVFKFNVNTGNDSLAALAADAQCFYFLRGDPGYGGGGRLLALRKPN